MGTHQMRANSHPISTPVNGASHEFVGMLFFGNMNCWTAQGPSSQDSDQLVM